MDLLAIELSIFEFFINHIHTPILNLLANLVTHIFGFPIWFIIAFVLLFYKRHRKSSLALVAAVGASGVMSRWIIKPIVARERPWDVFGFELFTHAPASLSMPSTHAAMTLAAAIVLFVTVDKRLGAAAFLAAFLVSVSRIYLLVHFPTDILAGIILGAFVATLTIIISRIVFKYAENRWPILKEYI
jgi:undecaprenyl-diphosphatase